MDETQRIDPHPPPKTVITLPPKHRVNIALAIVAGFLAILVLATARDTFVDRTAGAATPAPTAIASPAPTEEASTAPAAPVAPKGKPPKGRG